MSSFASPEKAIAVKDLTTVLNAKADHDESAREDKGAAGGGATIRSQS